MSVDTAHSERSVATEHAQAAASTMSLAGWATALGELELIAAAALNGEDFAEWEPPAELGQLPVELAQRARDVAALQERARGRLEADRSRLLAQLRAARKASAQLERSELAVFVDVRS